MGLLRNDYLWLKGAPQELRMSLFGSCVILVESFQA